MPAANADIDFKSEQLRRCSTIGTQGVQVAT